MEKRVLEIIVQVIFFFLGKDIFIGNKRLPELMLVLFPRAFAIYLHFNLILAKKEYLLTIKYKSFYELNARKMVPK